MLNKLNLPSTKPIIVCPHCSKQYKSNYHYDRHFAICDLVHQSKEHRERTEHQLDKIPSIGQLYNAVITLSGKCSKLQDEIEFLKLNQYHSHSQSHSHSSTAHSNTMHEPTQTFRKWLLDIPSKINDSHLNIIFENDYITGLTAILEELIHVEAPFYVENKKVFTFLIYNKSDWTSITDSNIDEIVSVIGKYIVTELVKWQRKYMHLLSSDQHAIMFSENTQKAIGGKYSRNQIIMHTRKIILKILKSRI